MPSAGLRKLTPLDRQRDAAVDHQMRYEGFGWTHGKVCHEPGCGSKLTAKAAPHGAWSCPLHWPVTQLQLLPRAPHEGRGRPR